MNDKIEIKPQVISPLKKICMTIGELPTSYLETMTYYEMLVWFTNYLRDTIIPVVNNNGEAVTELQNLFVELQTYVNNYFDNLDVQEEINNKLDVMAQDGTLEKIINQEIFGQMNTQISTNTNNISTLETKVSSLENDSLSSYRTIFVGDSYLAFNNSYGDIYKTLTGLADGDYYKFASNGAGFVATGSGGKNFYQVLNENLSNVNNKNTIRKIIVGCCYNDAAYASGHDIIINAMTSFRNLCKTNFPNAKIYVIGCGYNVAQTSAAGTARFNMQKIVMSAISNQTNQDMIFVDGSNMWLRNTNWFNEDLIHPNATGQEIIAKRLVKYMLGQTYVEHINADINLTVFGNSYTMKGNIYGDKAYFELGDTNMTTGLPTSYNTDGFNEIGTWTSDLVHPSSVTSLRIPSVKVLFLDSTEGWHFCENATLSINPDGKVYLISRIAKSSGGMYTFNNLTRIIIYGTFANINMAIN